MTIKQLRKRLERLPLVRGVTDGPDRTLAAQWSNSAAAKQDTDEEALAVYDDLKAMTTDRERAH